MCQNRFMDERPSTIPAEDKVIIKLRLRLPVISFLFLLVAALLLPNQVWNTLLIGLGGLFLVGYVWVRQLAKHLHGSRQLRYGWVAVGDRLEERFDLFNDSFIPALWVEIIDYTNIPGYRTAVVRSVPAQSSDHWRETAVCQQRGMFSLGPWAIRSSDPFGLFQMTRFYTQTEEIIIHPPIHGQLPIPLPTGTSSGQARVRQRSWQATTNAASVRDYQIGDPQRWIHWPISAHKNSLYVREFDQDATGDIWILLDCEAAVQLGSGAERTIEQAVLLGASLAARAVRQNRAVGLAGYGRSPQIVHTGSGQGQQWRILRALALLDADGATDLQTALFDLGRITKRGTAVIIITPSGSGGWLPELARLVQRGVESNVVLLDRQSFGGEENSEGLATAVRQLGFPCQVIRQGEIGTPLEEQQRRGFWEFRVSGTGKVVAVKTPAAR
ncbi:MAG: DUF58 domain-containing protein [Ardenticatenaceae bacterium]|nr:DUF58 domain-containing protein [Ardenticatenaceae bacterium]MCB8949541.1 DUF58 domain-containing protein [Ardenticatenaceae bacterium]